MNSRIAAGIVAEDAGAKNEIRYLDANRGDGLIKNKLPSPARWLELRDSPRNYVLGDRDDKRIFRSPVGAADPLGEKQFGDIAWLCEAQTILLNSPKDQEPVRAIFEQRSRRGFDVIFVLTPSLPKAGCTPGSKGSDWCVGRITVPHRWESGVDQWRGVGSGTATQDGVGRGDSRDHGQTRSVVHGGRLSRTYSY